MRRFISGTWLVVSAHARPPGYLFWHAKHRISGRVVAQFLCWSKGPITVRPLYQLHVCDSRPPRALFRPSITRFYPYQKRGDPVRSGDLADPLQDLCFEPPKLARPGRIIDRHHQLVTMDRRWLSMSCEIRTNNLFPSRKNGIEYIHRRCAH